MALVGVGGVGGTIASVLDHAGQCDLTLVARGATLEVLEDRGLTVLSGDEGASTILRCRPRCVSIDATTDAGPQDFLFLVTKAHQLPPMLDSLLPLIGPATTVVTCSKYQYTLTHPPPQLDFQGCF